MSDRRAVSDRWRPPTGPRNRRNKTKHNHALAPGQANPPPSFQTSTHQERPLDRNKCVGFASSPSTFEAQASNGVTNAPWPEAEDKQFDELMTLHWSEAICLSQPYRRTAEDVFRDVSRSMTDHKFNRSIEECYKHWYRVTQHKHAFKHTLVFPAPPGEVDDKRILSEQPSRPTQLTSENSASARISAAQTSNTNMKPSQASWRNKQRFLKRAQRRELNASTSNQSSTTANMTAPSGYPGSLHPGTPLKVSLGSSMDINSTIPTAQNNEGPPRFASYPNDTPRPYSKQATGSQRTPSQAKTPVSRNQTTSSPDAGTSTRRESGEFRRGRRQANAQQHSSPRPNTPSASGKKENSSVQGTESNGSTQHPSQTSAQQVTPMTTSRGHEIIKSSQSTATPKNDNPPSLQTSTQHGPTRTSREIPKPVPPLKTAAQHPVKDSAQTETAPPSDSTNPEHTKSSSKFAMQQGAPKVIPGRKIFAESVVSNDSTTPLRHNLSQMRIPASSTPSHARPSKATAKQGPQSKATSWSVRENKLLEEAVTRTRLKELQKRYHERAVINDTYFWTLIVEDLSGFGLKKNEEDSRAQWGKTFYSPGGLDIIRREVDKSKGDGASKIEDEAEDQTEDTTEGEIPGLNAPVNGEWSDLELRHLDALVLKHKGASFYDQDGPKRALNTGLTWENICHLHNKGGFSRSTPSIMYMWTHVRDKKCALPRPPMRYEIEPTKKHKPSRALADDDYEVIQDDEVDAQRLEASAKRTRPAAVSDDEDGQKDEDDDTPRAKRVSHRSLTPDNVMNRLHEAQDKVKQLQNEIDQNESKKRASDEKVDRVNQRLAELEKEKQALLADQIAATDESAGYAAEIAASTDSMRSVQNAINFFWH